MSTIGERIRWLRKDRCRLTQEIVGKHVGVGKATIQKYEKGVITNIPSDKIILLSEILETTPEYIMGWTENPDRLAKSIMASVPSAASEDERLNAEIISLFSRLSPDSKKQSLEYIQFLLTREEKK